MKSLQLPLAAAALLLTAALAPADPYDPAQVPADSQWVMHVDAKAFFGSKYGKLAIEDWKEFGLDKKVEHIRQTIGIDPLLGWEGLTVYGTKYEHGHGVALIEIGGRDRNNDAQLAKKDNYKRLMHGKYVVHSWDETWKRRNGDKKVVRHYLGVYRDSPQDVVIAALGRDLEMIHDALDTLAGRETSLADLKDGHPMATEPDAGSFFFVTGVGFAGKLAKNPKSFMFRNAEHLTLDLGEQRGTFYSTLTTEMKTANDAEAMANIMKGGVAMMKTHASRMLEKMDEEPATPLLEAIEITQDGTTVTADFEYESEPMFKRLKSFRQHWHERRAERRAKWKARRDAAKKNDASE